MLRKTTAFLTVLLLLLTLSAALGETAGDENKFESDWALEGGLAEILREEEGWRVSLYLANRKDGGARWEYNCLYDSAKNALVAVSAEKLEFTFDSMLTEQYSDTPAYDSFPEGKAAVFTINGDGKLLWDDPIEQAGEGLLFTRIGRFSGEWEGDSVHVSILWDRYDLFYSVLLSRSAEDSYTDFIMNGVYNPDSGRLEAMGTATSFTQDENGVYQPGEEDTETYEAFFSMLDGGKLLYEAENGIELTQVLDSNG